MKAAWGWMVCAACGGEPATMTPPVVGEQRCPADRTCDFDMELGTGVDEFTLLEPNDPVTVTLGPQGGFHVWVAVRCVDCSDQVLIEYGARGSADGTWLFGDPLRGIINLESAGGWKSILGLYALLPGEVGEVEYTGLNLTLEATIEDDERRASRVLPVTVEAIDYWDCPSGDPDSCEN